MSGPALFGLGLSTGFKMRSVYNSGGDEILGVNVFIGEKNVKQHLLLQWFSNLLLQWFSNLE